MLCTTTADGDMRPVVASEAGRRAIVDRRWCFVTQVHGAAVHVATGAERRRVEADAVVTTEEDLAPALLGADCALVGFSSREGVRGAAHAGWRGLLSGVIEETAGAMRALGAGELYAVVSPAIGPECYPFSVPDLDLVVAAYGEGVAGRSASGEPALDLPAGVSLALRRAAVTEVASLAGCTACDERFYSWRRGADVGRHALVVAAA